jgi:WD40 repeat protein
MLYGVRFSPGGDQVLTHGREGWLRLWGVAGGEPHRLPAIKDAIVYGADFTPDGEVMAGDSQGNLRRIDPRTDKVLQEFPNLRKTGVVIGMVRVAPDGRVFVVYQPSDDKADPATVNYVRAYDPAGEELFRCVGHTALVVSFALSADGQRLLSVSYNPQRPDRQPIRLWDAGSGKQLRGWQLKGSAQATNVALSQDKRWAVAAGHLFTLEYFDFDKPTDGRTWSKSLGSDSRGLAIVGERIICTTGDGRLTVWDRKGNIIAEGQLPGAAWGVVPAPDGRHVATLNHNGTVYIIRLPQ